MRRFAALGRMGLQLLDLRHEKERAHDRAAGACLALALGERAAFGGLRVAAPQGRTLMKYEH